MGFNPFQTLFRTAFGRESAELDRSGIPRLDSTVGRHALTHPYDTLTVSTGLAALGYHPPDALTAMPYAEADLDQSVRAFQTDVGLKVDGVINPGGPTDRTLRATVREAAHPAMLTHLSGQGVKTIVGVKQPQTVQASPGGAPLRHDQWPAGEPPELPTYTPPFRHGARENDGMMQIRPAPRSRPDLPNVDIPLHPGMDGFIDDSFMHDYMLARSSSLHGAKGLRLLGNELARNPTPGPDRPATLGGTHNDAGPARVPGWMPGIGSQVITDTNQVYSFRIPSNDPHRSDTIVNYTDDRDHLLADGYVLRYAQMYPNGDIEVVTVGQGDNAWQAQRNPISGTIEPITDQLWHDNFDEIEKQARQRYYDPQRRKTLNYE